MDFSETQFWTDVRSYDNLNLTNVSETPPCFWRRRWLKVFTLYEHGGHLGHVTRTIYTNFCSPFRRRLHMKRVFDLQSGFRKDVNENNIDGSRSMAQVSELTICNIPLERMKLELTGNQTNTTSKLRNTMFYLKIKSVMNLPDSRSGKTWRLPSFDILSRNFVNKRSFLNCLFFLAHPSRRLTRCLSLLDGT